MTGEHTLRLTLVQLNPAISIWLLGIESVFPLMMFWARLSPRNRTSVKSLRRSGKPLTYLMKDQLSFLKYSGGAPPRPPDPHYTWGEASSPHNAPLNRLPASLFIGSGFLMNKGRRWSQMGWYGEAWQHPNERRRSRNTKNATSFPKST